MTPPFLQHSIATRLFRTSFALYVVAAVVLTGLLVVGEFLSTRATLQRELTTDQRAFDTALAGALWAMETDKLDSIVAGMVAIPEIAGVRVFDPATGHLFVIALKSPEGAPEGEPRGVSIGRDEAQQQRWAAAAGQAVADHAFDIVYRHATGTMSVGRAELLSGRQQLIDRIWGQSALIIAVALFKEAILWAIFLAVSHRMLVRPLSELIRALDGAHPAETRRITLTPSAESMIAGTELMLLRDSLNSLSDRVHEHRAQLLALNQELESQVAERTLALEEANLALTGQAARLAATNAELEQFAYVASHDLKQPLRMVSSYVTLLERQARDRLKGDELEFIAFARDGASRMDRLITDLLEYSRTGRNADQFQPVALDSVLAEALHNLKVPVEEAAAEVEAAQSLPTVRGNRGELVRLFQNLIGNAIQYRTADVRPHIRISCHADQAGWVVSVRDNGIGIPAEQCERVFGIFQRLHTRAQYEGTGIGLAICKKIVEVHGGRIWVESESGEGATFFFTLPAAGPDIAGRSASASS
ncbi:sensor histidine kinase [Paramagnetospirillum magneticum]|uniref:histidine kinase n=1 Tax=Paramagnetospirillum magneticum (strain ATCC 700264 / AMB-1) TaxID=342108 RepID=Q2W695_PARM1|nr:ATP-binding protein [Paramagnetospirillum magneticum]BAE50630.1 Signal transduction histidine kinase [Paramagnetospirillum magneticum AMB-1]